MWWFVRVLSYSTVTGNFINIFEHFHNAIFKGELRESDREVDENIYKMYSDCSLSF
jgi:hypothetical protein